MPGQPPEAQLGDPARKEALQPGEAQSVTAPEAQPGDQILPEEMQSSREPASPAEETQSIQYPFRWSVQCWQTESAWGQPGTFRQYSKLSAVQYGKLPAVQYSKLTAPDLPTLAFPHLSLWSGLTAPDLPTFPDREWLPATCRPLNSYTSACGQASLHQTYPNFQTGSGRTCQVC